MLRGQLPWVLLLQLLGLACAQSAAHRDAAPEDLVPEATPSVPLPTAAPAIVSAPASVPEAAGGAPSGAPGAGHADLDPDNDAVVAPPEPLADCAVRLGEAKVDFRSVQFPLRQKLGNVFTCGTEQAVLYARGPEGFRFNARPQVTCRLALALARFEGIAQEEAARHLGRKIRKVTQAGTYSCRKMQRFTNMVSEHSYANAIDIKAFQLDDGKSISVLSHFGKLDVEPDRAESLFLLSLARRLYDEAVFSVVLTPFFDALHRDHFHLDLARYRLDGTR